VSVRGSGCIRASKTSLVFVDVVVKVVGSVVVIVVVVVAVDGNAVVIVIVVAVDGNVVAVMEDVVLTSAAAGVRPVKIPWRTSKA